MSPPVLVVRDTGCGPWSLTRPGQSASPGLHRARDDAVEAAERRLRLSGGAVVVLDAAGAELERRVVRAAPPY